MPAVPLTAEPSQTRLAHLRDLPRRGLVAGGGHVREICGSWGTRNQLEWLLQVVELRGPVGVMNLAPDATHVIAGIGGPQVEVGAGPATGLRKDRVLPYAGSHVEFHRPTLRAAELSRIVVLSSARSAPSPMLVFADLHGSASLPDDVRAVVVRSGIVRVDGSIAHAMDALVLPPSTEHTAEAIDARVLMLIG